MLKNIGFYKLLTKNATKKSSLSIKELEFLKEINIYSKLNEISLAKE